MILKFVGCGDATTDGNEVEYNWMKWEVELTLRGQYIDTRAKYVNNLTSRRHVKFKDTRD